jgi:hypothetical protein
VGTRTSHSITTLATELAGYPVTIGNRTNGSSGNEYTIFERNVDNPQQSCSLFSLKQHHRVSGSCLCHRRVTFAFCCFDHKIFFLRAYTLATRPTVVETSSWATSCSFLEKDSHLQRRRSTTIRKIILHWKKNRREWERGHHIRTQHCQRNEREWEQFA